MGAISELQDGVGVTGVSICVPVQVFAALERTEAHRDPCQLLQTATT